MNNVEELYRYYRFQRLEAKGWVITTDRNRFQVTPPSDVAKTLGIGAGFRFHVSDMELPSAIAFAEGLESMFEVCQRNLENDT
jgi:hypothetical protein